MTTGVAVGQMRQSEFIANPPGDRAFHCHKSHHIMNAMDHDVPTMAGVDHRKADTQISNLIPDYMVMGERGMADMGVMEMPLPDNTAPMMAKIRHNQPAGDYSDPSWYQRRKYRYVNRPVMPATDNLHSGAII